MRMLSVGHLGLGGVVVAESAIATSRLAGRTRMVEQVR